MQLSSLIKNSINGLELISDIHRVPNLKVLQNLAGPALRGLILQRAKNEDITRMKMHGTSTFNWNYTFEGNDYSKLYEKAKNGQWDGNKDLDWAINVDPYNEEQKIFINKHSLEIQKEHITIV